MNWEIHELRDLWALQEKRREWMRGHLIGLVVAAVVALAIVALLTW